MKNRRTGGGRNAVRSMRDAAVFIVIAAMLLCACGQGSNTGQTAQETETVQDTETAQETETVQETETAPEAAENAETAKEALPGESAGELPPWVLYESDDLSILLIDALDPDEMRETMMITVVNNSDHYITGSFSNIMINDTWRTSELGSCRCNPHETHTDDWYAINKWMAQFSEEIGDLAKISLHLRVSVMDPETYQTLDTAEKDISVTLPADYKTKMVFQPVFSTQADRQLLFQDEERMIELCALGKNPDDIDLYAFSGILRVENLSEHSIPADLAGIRVNGFYVDPYSYGRGTLAAGSERYLFFMCKNEDLELADIKSISSIELLLMTSDEENTGAFNDAGGSWYPVALTQTAEETEDAGQDVLIYEDEYVSVSFRESWLEWHDVDYTDPYGYYHWVLVVNNKSSENLEFALTDVLVNGAEEETLPSLGRVWPHNTDIGAGSKAVIHLQMSTDINDPIPELSFRIQDRTLGGGSLLYYSPDHVVIESGETGN